MCDKFEEGHAWSAEWIGRNSYRRAGVAANARSIVLCWLERWICCFMRVSIISTWTRSISYPWTQAIKLLHVYWIVLDIRMIISGLVCFWLTNSMSHVYLQIFTGDKYQGGLNGRTMTPLQKAAVTCQRESVLVTYVDLVYHYSYTEDINYQLVNLKKKKNQIKTSVSFIIFKVL